MTIFGILTWISLLVAHIGFVRARQAQNIALESLSYVAPLGIYGSYAALCFCIIVALTKNFPVFIPSKEHGQFDVKGFVTGYLGIPLYLMMIFGYKFYYKTKGVLPETADLFTGKDVIDREEAEFLAQQAALGKDPNGGSWFYRTFIGWLL